MAEFLILKNNSWATTKPATWDQQKFAGRQMAGDIVEVREDGYYRVEYLGTGRVGWDRNTFAVGRIPGLSLASCLKFAAAHMVQDVGVLMKFRYAVNMATTAWIKHDVVINGVTYPEWYITIASVKKANIIDKAAP